MVNYASLEALHLSLKHKSDECGSSFLIGQKVEQ
jgi:hypothetical protein